MNRFLKLTVVCLALLLAAGAGTAMEMTYDDLNRLKTVTYTDGARIEYVYDSVGNRTQKIVDASLLPGDTDANGTVDLQDVVLDLRIASGITPSTEVAIAADVNGDGKIGVEEAIYALQVAAGLR